MVKINQLTDNNNKKLLFKIIGVLFTAVLGTILLSSFQNPSLKSPDRPALDLPIIYEYAPIKITTADNREIWLKLYVEPYTNADLPKIHKNERKTHKNIQQKISSFSASVLILPENRRQIEMIFKKQIDLVLYPTTVKNVRFDLVRV